MSIPSRTVPKKRHLIPVLLTVALLVAGLAAPAFARATTTEVSATMTLTAPPQIEREWMSGPILHVRGAAVPWDLAGDLTGDVELVHNANFDTRSARGTGFGSIIIATEAATWEGRYHGKYTDGLFAGTLVVHGSDGTVMRGTVATTALDPVPVATLEGVILDRPGR